jgi:plastocyanin
MTWTASALFVREKFMSAVDTRRVLDLPLSRRATLRLSAALGAGALLGGQLRAVAAQDATPAAATYPELAITSTEYTFDMAATAESGYTRVTLSNQGAVDHHAMFIRLNDGVTEEQFQQVLMSGDLAGLAAIASAYGGPMASSGGKGSVIVFLDPGTYAVVCLIPDDQGVPHVAHGMISMLQVSEGTSAAPDPVADGTITLIEMTFDGLPAEVPAGAHTWQVTNGGTQFHEMGILQLVPGVPADAVIAGITAPPPASPVAEATPEAAAPPPFVAFFGAAPMSPGATNYVEFDAQPGEYVVVCFVPDAATGMPHAAMGMIASFTVA